MRFELRTDGPTPTEDRATIFQLTPPRVTQRGVLELARSFGLTGSTRAGTLCVNATQVAYTENAFELAWHRASGGLRFRDTARWQVDDGAANVDFDDDAAIEMASRIIDRFALAPLQDCRVLRVARLNVGAMDRATGDVEQRAIDVGVAFQRLVDGVPVEGAGGKVIVYLDDRGELTGFDRVWREIRPGSEENYPLRSIDSVQEELAREWGGDSGGLVRVDDSRLAYFESGWDGSQRYLQPAYFLPLTLVSTEGRSSGRVMMRSEYIAAAAVDPPEPVLTGRRATRPQSPREP